MEIWIAKLNVNYSLKLYEKFNVFFVGEVVILFLVLKPNSLPTQAIPCEELLAAANTITTWDEILTRAAAHFAQEFNLQKMIQMYQENEENFTLTDNF